MDCIFCDNVNNDLALDVNGNIQLSTGGYALSLGAACAIRTFLGEVFFDTTQGIPYLTNILGKNVSIEYVRALLIKAALTVPEIVSAQVYFTSFTNRSLTGQVQVYDSSGNVAASNF